MSHDLSTSSIVFMSTYMIELWDERFTRGYIYNYVGKGNLGPIMHVLNNPCLSFQLGVKGRNVSRWHCILCSMCVGIYVCVWLHHDNWCVVDTITPYYAVSTPHLLTYVHAGFTPPSLPAFPFPYLLVFISGSIFLGVFSNFDL